MKIRGFTLVEVLIASAMALLVMGVIVRVLFFARHVQQTASSSYLIREQAEVAFRRMQDDLRMSSLASIRVEPGDEGFSMISPLEKGDANSFELTPYGVPHWRTWVHYTVVPESTYTGNLVRWEAPVPKGTQSPLPSPSRPQQLPPNPGDSLLPEVVQAGFGLLPHTVKGSPEQIGALPSEEGGGGLRLRFLRHQRGEEILSGMNPSQQSDDADPNWSFGVTDIVDCRLQLADNTSGSGKWTVYTMNFRVAPRN